MKWSPEFQHQITLAAAASSDPDLRKIPNPAVNLHVIDEEDQRIGFFGHVILKVTWNHPDSKLACMHSGVFQCYIR